MGDVSAQHGIDARAIWDDLSTRARWVDGARRGRVVSFATTGHKAVPWAQRAPEIRTEALTAV